MSDEGFHEIQLNGKQLVFLFMAATVVSVVIFLLGVMVGRGVPTARVQAAEVAGDATVDPTAAIDTSASTASDSDNMPVSAQESLTYAERLESTGPAPDTLNEPSPAPAEAPKPVVNEPPPPPLPAREQAPPPAAAAAPKPAPVAASGDFAEPAGDGYVVQVAATSESGAKDIARRLASRGYPAFISARGQGLFAVRVGKYSNQSEAERVAARLEQQEQFNKPWVTR
jgi:cell division septation protein DedD